MYVPAEFLDQQHHQPHLPHTIGTTPMISIPITWSNDSGCYMQMQKSLNKRYIIESVEKVLHDSLNPKYIESRFSSITITVAQG